MLHTDRQVPLNEITGRLAKARRSWRALEIAVMALRGLTYLFAGLLAALLADNLLALPGWLRGSVGLVLLAVAVYAVLKTVQVALRPLTDEMVAVRLEKANPSLDNRLINAVLLQKQEFDDPITGRMAGAQYDDAVSTLRARDLAPAESRAALWRWGGWTGVLTIAIVLYAVLFSVHFSNAIQRYAMPHRYLPPLTDTQLSVSPGNVELQQGDALDVEAAVEGDVPEKAFIYVTGPNGKTRTLTMPFEGSSFSVHFDSVQEAFSYRVVAGDAASDTYAVGVRMRPGISRIETVISYPAYMGMPEAREAGAAGNISAPVGSRVRIEAATDRDVVKASLILSLLSQDGGSDETPLETPMRLANPRHAIGEFEITRSGQYTVNVTDAVGVANSPRLSMIVALPDEPPRVKVVDPGKEVAVVSDARVPVLAESEDDFSIRGMALYIQPSANAEWQEYRSWPCTERQKQLREGAVLDVRELGLKAGDVMSYYLKADDGCPTRADSEGKSRVYQITVVDKAVAEEKARSRQEAFRALVERLIVAQKENLQATMKAGQWPPASGDIAIDVRARVQFNARTEPLCKAQESIYVEAREGVRSFAESETTDSVQALVSIAASEMVKAVDQLDRLRRSSSIAEIAPAALAATATEQLIVTALEKLLADPAALWADRLAAGASKEKLPENAEDLSSRDRPKVEKMLTEIRAFLDEQREVLKATRQLAQTEVNDFTTDDDKALAGIVDMELKWAKYFQELATDLSKLPPQDFSIGGMAKEYLEVYTEIKKAADAAAMEAIELAVPLEQAGLELAESLETNIEKWLMETPDRIKWSMEDPIKDFDVPLSDLPDELEDMIGDLLEQEEDLLEEAADATSGWLDNMDKGAGWGTMDGPISNMSAKGVTGNVLPDSHEVGGRSGEGRTGKSSGQFVEETATGKGGRQTPTRLTPDAFESGSVKDTSSEPGTGSTGGGKSSGHGAEGLHGPIPPRIQGELKRIAQQQQQLLDKAQQLDYGIKKLNYPRGELPKTIELMEQVRHAADHGDMQALSTAGARQKIILSNLREIKDVVSQQKHLNRDSTGLLPKELRDEIATGQGEKVPERYEDMVRSYLEALSHSGTVRPIHE